MGHHVRTNNRKVPKILQIPIFAASRIRARKNAGSDEEGCTKSSRNAPGARASIHGFPRTNSFSAHFSSNTSKTNASRTAIECHGENKTHTRDRCRYKVQTKFLTQRKAKNRLAGKNVSRTRTGRTRFSGWAYF